MFVYTPAAPTVFMAWPLACLECSLIRQWKKLNSRAKIISFKLLFKLVTCTMLAMVWYMHNLDQFTRTPHTLRI